MDDFPNQLRKQFPIDRVLENPGLVVTLYENERDHAADIIEHQQKRIEELEAGLARYSCACSEPCALYDAEKSREADMPHMMCGWWSKSVLEGK